MHREIGMGRTGDGLAWCATGRATRRWLACAACAMAAGCGGGGGGGSGGSPRPPMPLTGGTAAFLNTTAMTDSYWDSPDSLAFDTDGAGTWITAWHSFPLTGGTYTSEILFERSFDNGATWSDPEFIDSDAPTTSSNGISVDIATDRAGNWLAVWSMGEVGPLDPDVFFLSSRSVNNGETWSTPARLDPDVSFPLYDQVPCLKTNRAGRWIVTWLRSEDNGLAQHPSFMMVSSSDDLGLTWSTPVALSGDLNGYFGGLRLESDGADTWIAVWSFLDPTNSRRESIFMARSDDNGETWGAPKAITAGTGRESFPRLATDELGHWVVAFDSTGDFGGSDSDLGVIRSSDNGATWTSPEPLNSNAAQDSTAAGTSSFRADDTYVELATNGFGRWIAVWTYLEDDAAPYVDIDVAVSASLDNGATWSPQMYLNPDALDDDRQTVDSQPKIATDGGDRWIAAWGRYHATESLPSGIDQDLLYSTDFVEALP